MGHTMSLKMAPVDRSYMTFRTTLYMQLYVAIYKRCSWIYNKVNFLVTSHKVKSPKKLLKNPYGNTSSSPPGLPLSLPSVSCKPGQFHFQYGRTTPTFHSDKGGSFSSYSHEPWKTSFFSRQPVCVEQLTVITETHRQS